MFQVDRFTFRSQVSVYTIFKLIFVSLHGDYGDISFCTLIHIVLLLVYAKAWGNIVSIEQPKQLHTSQTSVYPVLCV